MNYWHGTGRSFNQHDEHLEHKVCNILLHMDMDIYPAALEVLDHFACRFKPGTVLVFDELINYTGWMEGRARGARGGAKLRRS